MIADRRTVQRLERKAKVFAGPLLHSIEKTFEQLAEDLTPGRIAAAIERGGAEAVIQEFLSDQKIRAAFAGAHTALLEVMAKSVNYADRNLPT